MSDELDALAAQYEAALKRWPEENLSAVAFKLDLYWETAPRKIWSGRQSALTAQIKVDIHGLTLLRDKLADILCQPQKLGLTPEDDIEDYLLSENDPLFKSMVTDRWVQRKRNILAKIPTYRDYDMACFILYAGRRLLPIAPYQTVDPNTSEQGILQSTPYTELLSILGIAAEWSRSEMVISCTQEELQSDDNDGKKWCQIPAHENDITTRLLISGANSIVSELIPSSHPCRDQIEEAMSDFRMSNSRYSLHIQELGLINCMSGAKCRAWIDEFIGNYTQSYFNHAVYEKSGRLNKKLFDIPRLYACYEQVKSNTESWTGAVVVWNQILCLADDYTDHRPLCGQAKEIKVGEPANAFLAGFIQDLNEETDPAVKERFCETMHDLFGTGNQVDALKLRDIWEEGRILQRRVKPYARDVLRPRWIESRRAAIEKVNFPVDLLWASLVYSLKRNRKMNKDQVEQLLSYAEAKWESPDADPILCYLDYLAA